MIVEETANILVVDDEPRNIKILQIQLQTRGYIVRTACDGEEALDSIKKDAPDLILLDINMPKIDGFEVVKRVRADKNTEFIPIIMITALRDTQENRIKAVEAGADDFIEKPFNSFEVLARIKSLLRIKQYHDTLEEYNTRLESELQMARNVQEILIPKNGPQEIGAFKIASHCSPALAVGGDFYDLWEIDENRMGFLISDVMGHGASAALITVFIKTILSEHRDVVDDNPAEIIRLLNTRFNDMISTHLFMFATAFCGVIDLKSKELVCANAGHPFPFLRSDSDSSYTLITNGHSGNGLGIWRESEYENCRYTFEHSSRMFLYTDGAYEVKNSKGEEFSVERLKDVVSECENERPMDLIEYVSQSISTFSDTSPNPDDLTLIVVQGNLN
ncbi:SpoIIE family protein phosphatase [Candidatus Poribacteria bacterium]|nr:SpoIIE family protein phosphatase [Candidatus Poribacteria bacterium]